MKEENENKKKKRKNTLQSKIASQEKHEGLLFMLFVGSLKFVIPGDQKDKSIHCWGLSNWPKSFELNSYSVEEKKSVFKAFCQTCRNIYTLITSTGFSYQFEKTEVYGTAFQADLWLPE